MQIRMELTHGQINDLQGVHYTGAKPEHCFTLNVGTALLVFINRRSSRNVMEKETVGAAYFGLTEFCSYESAVQFAHVSTRHFLTGFVVKQRISFCFTLFE